MLECTVPAPEAVTQDTRAGLRSAFPLGSLLIWTLLVQEPASGPPVPGDSAEGPPAVHRLSEGTDEH